MDSETDKIKFISANKLEKNKEDFFILDIREQQRYNEGHIKGAKHIVSYNDLKLGNVEIVRKKYESLPRNKPIVTVCNAGITAIKASQILKEMGHDSFVLEHGMMGWLSNYPVETD